MVKWLVTLVFCLAMLSAFAQEDAIETIGWGEAGKKQEIGIQSVPLQKGDVLIQGFSKKISGKTMNWHSHLDYAKEAMIVRTNNGVKQMVWESNPVPSNVSSDKLSLVWIAGISGLNVNRPAHITLYRKIKKVAEFLTDGSKKMETTTSKSYLNITPENMAPVAGENAILVHLREIAGKAATIKISSDVRQKLKVISSDVLD